MIITLNICWSTNIHFLKMYYCFCCYFFHCFGWGVKVPLFSHTILAFVLYWLFFSTTTHSMTVWTYHCTEEGVLTMYIVTAITESADSCNCNLGNDLSTGWPAHNYNIAVSHSHVIVICDFHCQLLTKLMEKLAGDCKQQSHGYGVLPLCGIHLTIPIGIARIGILSAVVTWLCALWECCLAMEFLYQLRLLSGNSLHVLTFHLIWFFMIKD